MATHYIHMDRDDVSGEAATGTSAPAFAYTKEGTVTWDSTTVTTKALLVDTFRKIKNYVHNDITRNGVGSAARKGYYIGIDDTENAVGYEDGGTPLTTGSGKDVTFEGQFIGTFKKDSIIELAERLEDAIAQMDFPLA